MKEKQNLPNRGIESHPIIKKCTCTHNAQDILYGKENRLWNHAPAKGSKPKRYRCTVCLKEQEF